MPSWRSLVWFILFYITDITTEMVNVNLTPDDSSDSQYKMLFNDTIGKILIKRQTQGNPCMIPPPLENGKYRPSTRRCLPPEENTPQCQMIQGTYVPHDWPIYLDYCNPGYKLNPSNRVSVCLDGSWKPRLPACEACTLSETTVNGKQVCREDVVFEDTFSNSLSDKWKHVVLIPMYYDYQFNVFHSDKKNRFIRNGSLVIRPTVYNDTHVTSGSLRLQGCTADNRKECERSASTPNLLPPVASAWMYTQNFSFRYGKLEIRAKFPVGDWLVPELWLDPKDHFYGPSLISGGIRIAMSRGNSDLQCSEEDIGLKRLESGIKMGPKENIRQHTFLKKLPENWHTHYHNFTVIWKPESISFRVNNENMGEIFHTSKTLCKSIGFPPGHCSIYRCGSNMAPFDKDFVISLGLSVGNSLDFPDNCTNRGKLKPWKNRVQKATLKFWQDRENWLSTWKEDESSLYIDYIRVTAL